MIIRSAVSPARPLALLQVPRRSLVGAPLLRIAIAKRAFSTSRSMKGKNRVYDTPVRSPDELYSYQRLSSSARTPLLTLWTTSWCATCRSVSPRLHSIIESGAGEALGGVNFCEVEYDAPDIMNSKMAMDYMITGIPTLLPFDGEYPILKERLTDAHKLGDERFMREWIDEIVRKHGGEGGGGFGQGLLGGLFGSK